MAMRAGGPRERSDQGGLREKATVGAVMLLARWTKYLESEMLGLSHVVGPGSVCIDIGAAAGLYTLALSHLVGASGHVHSIEPLSIARPVWTRVLGARSNPNVSYHEMALGTEPGSGVMSVPVGRYGPVTGRSFLTGRSHGLGSNAEFAKHMDVTVKVSTLDAMRADEGLERVDFIKVDVEGAELHILQGGEKTIETFKPTLLVEIEARHLERYDYSPEDIVGWLTGRGYTMHTWQNGWRPADAVWEGNRNYLFRMPGARQ